MRCVVTRTRDPKPASIAINLVIRIDTAIEASKRDETDALAEIRSLARAAIQPDAKDVLAKIKAAALWPVSGLSGWI